MPDGTPVRADHLTRFSSERQPEKTGRPRESKDLLTRHFLKGLADDFAQHGVAAIERVRAEEPTQYLKIVASLVPKEIELTRPMNGIDDDKLGLLIEFAEKLAALQPQTIEGEAVMLND